MEAKPPAEAKPADTTPAAAAAAPAAKPPAPPPPPMEAKQLDEITGRFKREYYQSRTVWIDGVDHLVEIVSITNSSQTDPAAFGATHPAIIVKYVRYTPAHPMHALPRGAPGAVTLPKNYEKVTCVYKA